MEKRIKELEEELYILYSSRKHSSPTIETLLDEVIDKLILLKSLLLEDSLSNSHNPALIFLGWLQDVLGNPAQIRIKDSRVIFNSPELAKICENFAKLLVEFKRTKKIHSFHENDLIGLIRDYREKENRRHSFSALEQEAFYFLLQEELPGKKDQEAILKFLRWYHKRRELERNFPNLKF